MLFSMSQGSVIQRIASFEAHRERLFRHTHTERSFREEELCKQVCKIDRERQRETEVGRRGFAYKGEWIEARIER